MVFYGIFWAVIGLGIALISDRFFRRAAGMAAKIDDDVLPILVR